MSELIAIIFALAMLFYRVMYKESCRRWRRDCLLLELSRNEVRTLRGLLQEALPHIECKTGDQSGAITANGEQPQRTKST